MNHDMLLLMLLNNSNTLHDVFGHGAIHGVHDDIHHYFAGTFGLIVCSSTYFREKLSLTI